MAAPAITVRQTPAGKKLEDGFKCVITFARYPALAVWEIDTGSPGYDGGEPINTTTQHNVKWRTMSPRHLMTMTPFDVKYAWDPHVYITLQDMINVPDAVTELYPDGSTLSYYAFVQKVVKDQLVEGTMPTGTMTIVPTNYDPTADVEADPVLVEVLGT